MKRVVRNTVTKFDFHFLSEIRHSIPKARHDYTNVVRPAMTDWSMI